MTRIALDPQLAALLRQGSKPAPAAPKAKPITATRERASKADMEAGTIGTYRKRGLISKAQETAALRLKRDAYVADGSGSKIIGRLVATYGPRMPQATGSTFDPPRSAGESRAPFDEAMKAIEHEAEFVSIIRHVVLENRAAVAWKADRNRSTVAAEAMQTLRLALNCLARHYRVG